MDRSTRGVWQPPTLTREGHPYLKAVASDGRVLQRVTVYPWDDRRELSRILYHLLDRLDPL